MFEADGRHLLAAEMATGEQPAVAGDDVEFGIDQDRHVEAERLDAVGDLLDLLALVSAGVARVGLELFDRSVNDRDRRIAGRQVRILLH